MKAMYFRYIDSPIGHLLLAGDDLALHYIGLPKNGAAAEPETGWIETESELAEPARQLQAYFCGQLQTFSLRLAQDGTSFQKQVWEALADIPYGETISYGELARRIGRPKAVRAVGAANGRNPLPIVLPCHRVIGSDGSLTGYGGGLAAKKTLLALEGFDVLEAER